MDGQTLEYSGDPHEYLNGEHVQEWESSQRTVQLPDGTKVTLSIDRLYKVFRILARL